MQKKIKNRPSRAQMLRDPKIYIEQSIIDDLIRISAETFGVPLKHMASRQRYHEVVIARNLCYFVLHVRYRLNPLSIAKMFLRDRTTVLHGTNRFLDDLKFLPYYQENYEKIISQLPEPKTITYAI